MKIKVMVTGKNRRIAVDISKHLEADRGYRVIKCDAGMDALFDTVPKEMPNVIIICLGDETKETVKVYDVLKDCVNAEWISIIVVANDDDTKVFMANTKLHKMFFMPRPVSLMALYSKLMEIESELDKNIEKANSIIKEYVNPDFEDKHRRKHVLIVDDDTDQLLQIKEHLSEFYEVTAVRSGKAAFKYLEKHVVDIMLLDYLMPEMDGPTVLATLKKDENFKTLPVIFLTGMTEKDAVLKTILELKPQGYLIKPAKKSEIVAKIIDVLG